MNYIENLELDKRVEARREELYDKAVRFFLDKSDFNADEWMDEKDSLEYTYYQEMENGSEFIENIALSIAEWNTKNPQNKINLIKTVEIEI